MNIGRYTCCLITFVSFLLPLSFNGNSDAAPLAEYKEALKVISDFAKEMCDEIPLEGEGENVELSGEAKAELDWMLKKLANIGIKGAGKYQKSDYQGVLREDLAVTLKESRDCKLEIFNQLKGILLDLPHEGPKEVERPRPHSGTIIYPSVWGTSNYSIELGDDLQFKVISVSKTNIVKVTVKAKKSHNEIASKSLSVGESISFRHNGYLYEVLLDHIERAGLRQRRAGFFTVYRE